MKYQCEMIQDLLPLYHDSVCSEATREAVDEHLAECGKCEAAYREMLSADRLEPRAGDAEKRQADSMRMVRSRNTWRAIVLGSAAFMVFAALILAAYLWMTSARVAVPEDYITGIENGKLRFSSGDTLFLSVNYEKYPKRCGEIPVDIAASSVDIDGETEFVLVLSQDMTIWDYVFADPAPWSKLNQSAREEARMTIPASWNNWNMNNVYYGDAPSISMQESTECFFTKVYLFPKYEDFEDFWELVSAGASASDPSKGRVPDEQKLEILEEKAVLLWEK